MGTLNYSTAVPAAKTVGEMQAMLARHGAASVSVQYDHGAAAGLSFMLLTPTVSGTSPCQWMWPRCSGYSSSRSVPGNCAPGVRRPGPALSRPSASLGG